MTGKLENSMKYVTVSLNEFRKLFQPTGKILKHTQTSEEIL